MRKPMHRWLASGIMLFCGAALAQSDYPNRALSLVHGFGAGGNADTVARIMGTALQKRLGQPVVVESRTGAGGVIASDYVARATPDGYTLVMLTGGHTASAAMNKSLPYDPVNDFATISTVTSFPFIVAVKTDSPIKDMADLMAKAKSAPGTATFSSVGVGTTQHLTGELLAAAGNVKMLHIPYRGGGATVQAVLAGDVDVLVDTATVAGPQIASGKMRALAVTSSEPWYALPDAPTANQTLPDFEVMSWLGLAAPAGTPPAIIEKLHAAVSDSLADPEVRKSLLAVGSQPALIKPQEMHDMIARDIKRWKEVVRNANIPLQ